ncbi:MAG TPA: hypothetical protein PLD88_06760, partial [Candidatus Berkiella sp.]|nr:hypothetical protein [Candidatus Berkiella sp.]
STQETQTLVKLFEKLCSKHLTDLDQSRQALLEHLPAFLEKEAARIREANPDLVVAEKPTKKMLTKFKKEAETAKASPKTKVKPKPKTEAKGKTVVKTEPADGDDEAPVILTSTRTKSTKSTKSTKNR